MDNKTPILLGEYLENYVSEQVASGKYVSESEVVRDALYLFEQEQNKVKLLVDELIIGENSPKIKNFDRDKNLQLLKVKLKK